MSGASNSSAAATPGGRNPSRFGVRGKLLALVILVLLPTLTLDALQIFSRSDRQVAREEQVDLEFAGMIASAFVGHLEHIWGVESALGNTLGAGGAVPTPLQIETMMRAQIGSLSTVRRVSWIDAGGTVLAATSGDRGAAATDGQSFRRILQGEDKVVSDLLQGGPSGDPVFVVARAIRQGGQLLGVVAAELDARELGTGLPMPREGSRGFGVVDSQGRVVYRNVTPDLPWEQRRVATKGPIRQALTGTPAVFGPARQTVDDVPRVGAAAPIPSIGWAAFVAAPLAEVLAATRAESERNAAIALLVLAGSLAMALVFAAQFLRPIKALEQTAMEIAQGNLSARVRFSGGDELAAAAQVFDRMASRIEQAEAQLQVQVSQQAAIAGFGQQALGGASLTELMQGAVDLVARALDVELVAILELLPDGSGLRARAGSGWREGVIGHYVASAGPTSLSGYTLHSSGPVIVSDLDQETRFTVPQILHDHGVAGGVSVIIPGRDRPFGVMAALSKQRRLLSADDIHFLQSVANVLAAAIARRSAEETLRGEKERLDTILNTILDGVISIDESGIIERFNPAAERIFGYKAAEVVGANVQVLMPEPHRSHHSQYIRNYLTTGETKVIGTGREVEGRRRDGSTFPLDLAVSEMHFGGERRFLGVARDVTERHRAEAELATRARQQAAVADLGQRALVGMDLPALLDEAVILVAHTLQVEFAKVLELLPDGNALRLVAGVGWQPGLVGRVAVEAGLDSQAGYTLFSGLLSREPVLVDDLRKETRFSGPPLLHEHGVISGMSVVIPGQGRPYGVLGAHTAQHRRFTRDDAHFLQAVANVLATTAEARRSEGLRLAQHAVTRVLAESATLREAVRGSLQAICEHLDWLYGGFWVVDRQAAVLHAWEMWHRPGVDVQEFWAASQTKSFARGGGLIGRAWDTAEPAWVSNVATELQFARMQEAARAGLHGAAFFPVLSGSEVWGVMEFLSDEVRPPDTPTLQTVSATGRQLGQYFERKRAEEERAQLLIREQEARTVLQAAQRHLEAKTLELQAANQELEAFSYSVSHDLRAPLRSIDGFSLALLEDYEAVLNDEARDYLHRIRAGSQRMAQLIDDLLKLSRVTRSELRREAVDLSALARDVTAELRKLRPEKAAVFNIGDGLICEGDGRLLRVVLENLLGNAWKFTDKQPLARIEFGANTDKGQKVYFVRDNGAGFDMAYADKLFGPFQRLHSPSEFEGTGIGLATVERIIRRHGGRVWAESEVGKGATFFFTL